MLDRFDGIRRGGPYPHKPLLLLLALGRVAQGKSRLVEFAWIDQKLRRLLAQFGRGDQITQFSTVLPFGRLRNDGLWEIPGDATLKTTARGNLYAKELIERGVQGGFPKELYDQLASDPVRVVQVANFLLKRYFPPVHHDAIRDAVGLSSGTTSGGGDCVADSTLISDVKSLLNDYWRWSQENTTLRPVGDLVEITTPHLDRHNDCLQVYVGRTEAGFVIADDRYVLDDLAAAGVDASCPRRGSLLTEVLNGFGVQEVAGALQVEATVADFGPRKHNLLQAMLAVSDLFYLASPTSGNPFRDDVATWLANSGVRFTPDVKLRGVSSFHHKFDFVVPKSSSQPERVCRSISPPDRRAVQDMAFAWHDTKQVRKPGSVAFAIINDFEEPVSRELDRALRNYDVRTVPWSEREDVVGDLVA